MALVEILLNGETSKLKHGTTVDQLVRDLGLVTDRVAVEYNLHILKKKHWAETALEQGDRVEIVHFVGGGAGPGAVGMLGEARPDAPVRRRVSPMIGTTPLR
jgi:thiamine biosynthesis protein ThiS